MYDILGQSCPTSGWYLLHNSGQSPINKCSRFGRQCTSLGSESNFGQFVIESVFREMRVDDHSGSFSRFSQSPIIKLCNVSAHPCNHRGRLNNCGKNSIHSNLSLNLGITFSWPKDNFKLKTLVSCKKKYATI